VTEAEAGFTLALAANRPWSWGEAAIWLWRGGGLCEAPERTPKMFALPRRSLSGWERDRRRLRGAGVRSLPRGPRAATQANPRGLTPRQLEILPLLAEGLHNTEIAARLSTTPKTMEHHVTAVLAKLKARSRAEAVRLAFEQRLIPRAQLGTSAATFPVI
jgi:DNA-binding CsgD family transcriptional regulator